MRPLVCKWRAKQSRRGNHRPLAEMIAELEDNDMQAVEQVRAEMANTSETTVAVRAAQPTATRSCLRDVWWWFATEQLCYTNCDIASIIEAAAALTRSSRPRANDVRPLLCRWRVKQQRQGHDMPLSEILSDLEDQVIQAFGNCKQSCRPRRQERLESVLNKMLRPAAPVLHIVHS